MERLMVMGAPTPGMRREWKFSPFRDLLMLSVELVDGELCPCKVLLPALENNRGVWRHLYAGCGDLSVAPCNSQFPARLLIPDIVVVAWHGWKEKQKPSSGRGKKYENINLGSHHRAVLGSP